jgi:hypothetical protein
VVGGAVSNTPNADADFILLDLGMFFCWKSMKMFLLNNNINVGTSSWRKPVGKVKLPSRGAHNTVMNLN